MLKIEILNIIIAICNVTSLETNSSKWTELRDVAKYRKECRVKFYDCLGYKNGEDPYVSPIDVLRCDRKTNHD